MACSSVHDRRPSRECEGVAILLWWEAVAARWTRGRVPGGARNASIGFLSDHSHDPSPRRGGLLPRVTAAHLRTRTQVPMKCSRCGQPLLSVLEQTRGLCATCHLFPQSVGTARANERSQADVPAFEPGEPAAAGATSDEAGVAGDRPPAPGAASDIDADGGGTADVSDAGPPSPNAVDRGRPTGPGESSL
jgi:hypothetical protein